MKQKINTTAQWRLKHKLTSEKRQKRDYFNYTTLHKNWFKQELMEIEMFLLSKHSWLTILFSCTLTPVVLDSGGRSVPSQWSRLSRWDVEPNNTHVVLCIYKPILHQYYSSSGMVFFGLLVETRVPTGRTCFHLHTFYLFYFITRFGHVHDRKRSFITRVTSNTLADHFLSLIHGVACFWTVGGNRHTVPCNNTHSNDQTCGRTCKLPPRVIWVLMFRYRSESGSIPRMQHRTPWTVRSSTGEWSSPSPHTLHRGQDQGHGRRSWCRTLSPVLHTQQWCRSFQHHIRQRPSEGLSKINTNMFV